MTTFLEKLRGDPARVRLERLERLQGLTEELSAAQTREDVTRVIFERGLGLVDAAAVMLFAERAPGTLELVHGLGLSEAAAARFRRLDLEELLPACEAAQTARPVWLPTPREIGARFPRLVGVEEAEAIVALPVTLQGTRGVLKLVYREPRAFDDEERGFILAIARQCTAAVERASLFDDRSRAAERLRHLFGAAAVLSAAATPRDVAAAAFRGLGALGACAAEVHDVLGEERVVLLARHGRGAAERGSPVALDAPTPAAEVIRTGKAIWLESPEEIAARFPSLEDGRAQREEGAWAVVPLLSSGRTVGALLAVFPEPRRILPDDRTFVRLVAQPCAQALDRRRLFDEATGARSEALWTVALLSGLTAAAPIGIALLDRDMRFLSVNEKFSLADGVPVQGHLGRTPLEILPGAPAEQVIAAFRTVLETGEKVERQLEGEVAAAPGVRVRYATTWFPVRVRGEVAGVGVLVRGRR